MLPRLEEVFSTTKLTLPETVTAPMGPIIEGSNGNLEFGQVFRNNPFLTAPGSRRSKMHQRQCLLSCAAALNVLLPGSLEVIERRAFARGKASDLETLEHEVAVHRGCCI